MSVTTLISNWLKKVEAENPPPTTITALYFGIFKSDKGYMVYVTGAEVYDANDDEWAGEIDYQPARVNKYLLLPGEFTKGLKWAGVLALVAITLKEIVLAPGAGTLFSNRVAAAGFDDGDLVWVKSE